MGPLQVAIFNELILDRLMLEKMSPEFFADFCVIDMALAIGQDVQAVIPEYLRNNLIDDGFLAALIYRGSDVYLGFLHYPHVPDDFLISIAESLMYMPNLIGCAPPTYH